jgi:hypothetical protein
VPGRPAARRGPHGKGHFPPLLSADGVLTPAQVCALRTQRMLEVDGVPQSALEALVQASYHHAQQNPDAGARWVSEPLRLYDCSRENDGAAAVLVTSAEWAGDLRPVPACVLSGVQGAGPDWSESAENNAAYTSAGFHLALVPRLWAEAGLKPGQRDRLRLTGYGLTFRPRRSWLVRPPGTRIIGPAKRAGPPLPPRLPRARQNWPRLAPVPEAVGTACPDHCLPGAREAVRAPGSWRS